MILVFHILVALTSLAHTGYLFLSPSKSKLNVTYVLVLSTLVSGTYLVLMNSSHLASACLVGLVYLVLVLPVIVFTRNKLARAVSE